jgi:hypothetical protein
MYQQNLKKNYIEKQLESIQLTDTIKVVMSDVILDKIKYLCREIAKVEWSGIILYIVEGTIQKPTEMSLILKDIIPMNKGTQAYTEYNFNEKKRDSSGYEDRMIDYFCSNPAALEEDWKIGHIHSHNTMNVFFSGTDISELEDNCPSHNIYFSLIVNNFMEFKAKVAFLATIKTEVTAPYKALDENGEEYIISSSKLSVKKEKMFMYDCVVDAPEDKRPTVDDIFFNSVKEIIKIADTPAPIKNPAIGMYQHKNPIVGVPQQQRNFPQKVQKPFSKTSKALKHSQKFFEDLYNQEEEEEEEEEEFVYGGVLTETEIFIITLLRNGTRPDNLITNVEDALEEIDAFKEVLSPLDMSNSILEVLPAIFEDFYADEAQDDEFFIDKIKEVVEVFESYEENYTFLSRVILAINSMLSKFEENGATV